MDLALDEAREAATLGEVPIGAVVVSASGEVLGHAGNRTLAMCDPTAHAELLAIRQACARIGSERLVDCDLYVTLEPCAMCAAAISFARIRRLYFGAADPKGGAAGSALNLLQFPTLNHHCQITGGVRAAECRALLKQFFAAQRHPVKKTRSLDLSEGASS